MKKEEEDKKPAKRITTPSDKTPKKIKEQKNALISKGGMDEKKLKMLLYISFMRPLLLEFWPV